MRRAISALILLALVGVVHAQRGPARAQEASCTGSWLIQITLDERDLSEEALIAFDPDGSVALHAPPVLPALPGPGEIPLLASDGLGAWQALDDGGCAFEVVRVLAADDGASVGTLDMRGTATAAGGMLTGPLDIVRATGFSQTAATATGSFTGTPVDGPLLWLTPAAEGADN